MSTQTIPSKPAETPKALYTLYYRKGNNPHAMTKNFYFAGSLREVVERAKKHCETIGGRFVRIEPFVSDLAQDERSHLGLGARDADGPE